MCHPIIRQVVRRALVLHCALIALVLPQVLHAGPNDLFKIDRPLVEDLTVDATFGILYFKAGGRLYVYQPNPTTQPVNLAELAVMIGKARNLLVEEIIPPQSSEYYDGKTARTVRRVVVQFGSQAKR